MTTPLSDKQRILILDEYRSSGLTQEAFCKQLRASQGIVLAARTLRAWSRRLEQPSNSNEACVQIVSEAIQRLQNVREALQAGNRQFDAPGADQVATGAGAASVLEAPTAAASPTQAQPPAAVPSGMPPGNPPAPIEFMATEEPAAPEKPRRRPGGVIWIL